MTRAAAGSDSPRVGLALGGGGAKGLAHIPMLQTLDKVGVKPVAIAGTSIGAIMGTLYAAGISGDDIFKGITQLVATPKSFQELFEAKQVFAWLEYFDLDIGRGSLFQIDKFLDEMEEVIGFSQFEDLPIPLKVVATDFWAREEVILQEGPIKPAVAASFALPGVFKPVLQGEQVLIDGGSVNPVPYDLLQDECDFIIAIDVMGQRRPDGTCCRLIRSHCSTLFRLPRRASCGKSSGASRRTCTSRWRWKTWPCSISTRWTRSWRRRNRRGWCWKRR